jgi:DNA-binding PadR family transcriptional regulator
MAVLSEGPLHGYGLVDRLKDSPMMKGDKPDATGIYRLLGTLEELGMVTHRVADSDLGPSKRVFELTAAGRQCVSTWICTLEQYQQDLVQLIQFMRQTTGTPE